MNSARAAIAPPPASSSRCGAALASARASSSSVNGALRLNWLPVSSRRACERASRSSAPASCHPCSRVTTSGASQLYVRYRPLSPGSDANPATSAVTSTGAAPAADGTNPRGTAERSGAEPTTWMRTPAAARAEGTGPLAPASSIGQRSGRQGPSRSGPGSHRPSGAIAAGRTITPSSRTGFISTTSVCDPRPSPCSRARAWSATPGLTAPCQVTRTSLSSGDVWSSTDRALSSLAICDSAATPAANAAASAMPTAGSSHLAGRRRARAAASISGADKPRRRSHLSHARGGGDQGGSRASCRDRFVTPRLISAIQESGKLVHVPGRRDPNEPTGGGTVRVPGNHLPCARAGRC